MELNSTILYNYHTPFIIPGLPSRPHPQDPHRKRHQEAASAAPQWVPSQPSPSLFVVPDLARFVWMFESDGVCVCVLMLFQCKIGLKVDHHRRLLLADVAATVVLLD